MVHKTRVWIPLLDFVKRIPYPIHYATREPSEPSGISVICAKGFVSSHLDLK